jgi:hypothetical protein
MVETPFEVKKYLGHGVHGSVFLVDLQGEDVALKIMHTPKADINHSFYVSRARNEFGLLEKLSGIQGIPEPIGLLDDIKGTYEELGLDKCGLSWKEVVPRYIPHMGTGYMTEPYFAGAFLLDSVPDPMSLISLEPNTLTSQFFEELAWIYIQSIGRGIYPGFDAKILVSDHKPFIVDWVFAVDTGKAQKGLEIEYNVESLDPVRRAMNYHMRDSN